MFGFDEKGSATLTANVGDIINVRCWAEVDSILDADQIIGLGTFDVDYYEASVQIDSVQ